MPNVEYPELKPIKYFLFEFFKSTNEFRTVGRATALFLISFSFLQLFYLFDNLVVGHNLVNPSENYTKYNSLSVFDFISIAYKFSLIIPLLDYDINVFNNLYPIVLILIYVFTLIVIIALCYVTNCVIKSREIYFSIFLDVLSAFFLFFQWVIFTPVQMVLLYPMYGVMPCQPYDSIGIKIVNIILSSLFFIISFVIALFNNDALNISDNLLCRRDGNVEIWLNIHRIVLITVFIVKPNQAFTNAISFINALIILYIFISAFRAKHYYNDLICNVFNAGLLCYIKIAASGLIAMVWKVYLHDFSFTVAMCFALGMIGSSFVHRKRKDVFIKKHISDIKDVDEFVEYIEVLEEEANKSVNGDPISAAKIAGFILEHRNTCKQATCPLKNEGELFLPLINKSEIISLSNQIENLFDNEIFLIHLIKEVFAVLSSKFYGKPKFHFAYARFLLYRFGNIKLALIEIENSKTFSHDLSRQFSFFILKHIANERLLNNQYYIANYAKNNISIVDVLDVIVFDHLCKEIENEIYLVSKLKNEFWKILLKKQISLESLYKKGASFLSKKTVVDKIWNQINLITDRNKQIRYLYYDYLHTICDVTDSLHESQIEEPENDSELEDDDLVENRFDDEISLFIIDTSFGSEIGFIRYYNDTVCRCFGFDSNELINKNISLLMPETIAKVHNAIIEEFLESGRTKLTGNNTQMFLKGKNKSIKQIFLLIMPMPSFDYKNETLGLIRETKSQNFFVLFDEFGVIDSYSENFKMLFDESEPREFDFFIFYFFPFLLSPVEHLKHTPLFLLENTLMENSQNQICAYFDPHLFPILNEVISAMINNKAKNMKRRRNAETKFDYTKLSEEQRRKFSVYSEFCKSLMKMKENLKTENFHINQNDFNLKSPYIDQFTEYKNLIEEYSDSNEISKQIFNCKISLSHFNNGKNKIYIMELSAPSSDAIFPINAGNLNNEESKSERRSVHGNPKKNEIFKEPQNTDETGSVSNKTKLSYSAIQMLIQNIRDDKRNKSNFSKTTYMNMIFYLFLLILLGFIIAFIFFLNSQCNQLDLILEGFSVYITFIEGFFELRKLSHIELVRYTQIFPNVDVYNINSTLAYNAVSLLQLQRNISDILFRIENNQYATTIITMLYESKDNKFETLSEVESELIKNNIYITDVTALQSEDIVSFLTALKIDITTANFAQSSPNKRISMIKYILSKSDSILFDLIQKKQMILRELFDITTKHFKDVITYCAVALGISAFICMTFVFLTLRKMYLSNLDTMNKLASVKKEDITEIIKEVDHFVGALPRRKISEATKCEIGCDDESDEPSHDAESEQLIASDTNEKETRSVKLKTRSVIEKDNNGDVTSQLQNEKTSTKIKRRTKILLSFSANIILIIVIIITFLVVVCVVVSHFISLFIFHFDFLLYVTESKLSNIVTVTSLRDAFISNNSERYNASHSNEEYIPIAFSSMKTKNLNLFSFFAKNEKKFITNSRSQLISLFYTDLCQVSMDIFIFDCSNIYFSEFDSTKVFAKGMKYSIDYFVNLVDYLRIQFLNTLIKENYDLYSVFVASNKLFIAGLVLNDYYLKIIYDYIAILIKKEFKIRRDNLFNFGIIFSVTCLFLLMITICVRWRKYSNKIKEEEFMSIKLIAEVPIKYIMKNNELLTFLKNYVIN